MLFLREFFPNFAVLDIFRIYRTVIKNFVKSKKNMLTDRKEKGKVNIERNFWKPCHGICIQYNAKRRTENIGGKSHETKNDAEILQFKTAVLFKEISCNRKSSGNRKKINQPEQKADNRVPEIQIRIKRKPESKNPCQNFIADILVEVKRSNCNRGKE